MVAAMAGDRYASAFGRFIPKMARNLAAMPEDELRAKVEELAQALWAVANGQTVTVNAPPILDDLDDQDHDDEHDDDFRSDALPPIAAQG